MPFPNRTPVLGLNFSNDAAENWNWSQIDQIIANAFKPGDPIQLPLTGVVAGSYGDASDIPVFTVDATGRIFTVTPVPILISDANITNISWTKITGAPTSFPPSGPAGGDLLGSTYPNPIIAPLAVSTGKLANGAVTDAKVSDVAWGKITGAPTIPTSLPPSGPAGGDLVGSSYPNPVIAGGAVSRGKLAPNAPNGTAVFQAIPTVTNFTGPLSWVNVCTPITIATRGGCVFLFATPCLSCTGVAGGTNFSLRFLYDGTRQVTQTSAIVNTSTNYASLGTLSFVDAGPSGTGVPAGTHTYAFQINVDTGGGANAVTSNIAGGGFIAMEVG